MKPANKKIKQISSFNDFIEITLQVTDITNNTAVTQIPATISEPT